MSAVRVCICLHTLLLLQGRRPHSCSAVGCGAGTQTRGPCPGLEPFPERGRVEVPSPMACAAWAHTGGCQALAPARPSLHRRRPRSPPGLRSSAQGAESPVRSARRLAVPFTRGSTLGETFAQSHVMGGEATRKAGRRAPVMPAYFPTCCFQHETVLMHLPLILDCCRTDKRKVKSRGSSRKFGSFHPSTAGHVLSQRTYLRFPPGPSHPYPQHLPRSAHPPAEWCCLGFGTLPTPLCWSKGLTSRTGPRASRSSDVSP